MGRECGPLVFLNWDIKIIGERYCDEIYILYFLPFYLAMRTKYGLQVLL